MTASLIVYVEFFFVSIFLIFLVLLPLSTWRLESLVQNSLGYRQWLHVDNDLSSATCGRVFLSTDVVTYAKSRYGDNCNVRPWHVFLRSAHGRPYAISFDWETREVTDGRFLSSKELAGLTFSQRATCVDDPIESQFKRVDAENEQTPRRKLLALSKRFTYEVGWTTGTGDSNGSLADGNGTSQLYVTFTDRYRSNKTYSFVIPGYESIYRIDSGSAVVSTTDDGDATGAKDLYNALPAWSLFRRLSNTNATSNDAGLVAPTDDPIAGTLSYSSSPCYDKTLRRQIPGTHAITDLNSFAKIYFRGTNQYDPNKADEYKEKLKRLYYDCSYDSDLAGINEFLLYGFPVRLRVKVCPETRPVFDDVTGQCRTKVE